MRNARVPWHAGVFAESEPAMGKTRCRRKKTDRPFGRPVERTDRKISAWRTGEHDGRPSDRTAPAHKLVSIVPQRFQDLKMFPTANLTSNKGGDQRGHPRDLPHNYAYTIE